MAMTFTHTLKGNRGSAASLLEVVVVIAVVAILISVGLRAGADRLEDAKEARAAAEVEVIGLAVHSFMRDTGVPPAFKSGQATSGISEEEIYFVLETEGNDAVDATESWPTEPEQKDLIGNHLVQNQPGETGPAYRRRGEIDYDRHRGWNGPYLSKIGSDPWADKYLINVQFLTPKGVELVSGEEEGALDVPISGRVAVFVLSPGADRTIDTRFDQLSESFEAGGDDIIFRIQ